MLVAIPLMGIGIIFLYLAVIFQKFNNLNFVGTTTNFTVR